MNYKRMKGEKVVFKKCILHYLLLQNLNNTPQSLYAVSVRVLLMYLVHYYTYCRSIKFYENYIKCATVAFSPKAVS